MGDVIKFLKQTKISDLFSGEKADLIHGKVDDPAIDSLKKLLKARVLSIPLYDDSKKAYTCFFDILDVLHFVAANSGSEGTLSALEGNAAFKKTTSGEIANLSGRNHFVPIPRTQTLVEAMLVMTHDYPTLHRLPVVDEKGQLVGILSQSRIVRFLSSHVDKFDFGSLSIKQTNLGIQPVFNVNVSQPVSDALKLIKEKNVSACAIVDKSESLVGVFSATDLRLLGFDDKIGKIATRQLKDFVESVKVAPGETYPIAVDISTSTGDVVRKFLKDGVHRIYIVDDKKKPTGVISLFDILELFIRHILIE